jgi:hypothetical protein
MLLSNWQIIEYSKYTLYNLYWWVGAIWVLRDPHFKESASLHLKEEILNVLLPQKLGDFLNHFESIESLSLGLDGLNVE